MSELSGMAIIMGSVIAMAYALCLFIPNTARRWIKRLPRNRWIGGLLAGVDLFWAAWLLYHASLSWFESYRQWLFLATPVMFVLVLIFMDELLAARALGGLLLLIPAPILAVARWHDSPWRLVVVILCYVLVVKGMVLILSPYQFRKKMAVWIASDARCRTCGAIGMGIGLFVIALGLWVY